MTIWAIDLRATGNTLQLAIMSLHQRPWFAIHVLKYSLPRSNDSNGYRQTTFVMLLPNLHCHRVTDQDSFAQRKESCLNGANKVPPPVCGCTKNHLVDLPVGEIGRRDKVTGLSCCPSSFDFTRGVPCTLTCHALGTGDVTTETHCVYHACRHVQHGHRHASSSGFFA